MADVFLSYKSEDRDDVARIAEALAREGYSVWWDERLEVGRRYTDDIGAELAAAKAVIVVWSEGAVGSDWVREEANQARESGKLIPVRIASVRPPPPFAQFECAELIDWDGRAGDGEWMRVRDAVGNLVRGRPHDARSAPLVVPKGAVLSSSAGTIAMEDVLAVTRKPGWGGMAQPVRLLIFGLAFLLFFIAPVLLILDQWFLGILPASNTLYEQIASLWSRSWWQALLFIPMALFLFGTLCYCCLWLFSIVAGDKPLPSLIPGLCLALFALIPMLQVIDLSLAVNTWREMPAEQVRRESEGHWAANGRSVEQYRTFRIQEFGRDRRENAVVVVLLVGIPVLAFLLRLIYRAAGVSSVEITTRRGAVKWDNLRAEEADAVVHAFAAR